MMTLKIVESVHKQKVSDAESALPPLFPFQIIAGFLKGSYLLVCFSAVLLVGLPGILLTAMSAGSFRMAVDNMSGGPGALLLGVGLGALLLAAALPLAKLAVRAARRFLRAVMRFGRSDRLALDKPITRRRELPTLEAAYLGSRSLSKIWALMLLACGISAVGLGLALDGLQMLVLPYMTHPLL